MVNAGTSTTISDDLITSLFWWSSVTHDPVSYLCLVSFSLYHNYQTLGINSGIDGQFWNYLFKKMELELKNLELKFSTKKNLNPQINLPFNFLIQKYFFHDKPTWNINYYSE